MKPPPFTVRSRIKSFKYAFKGIYTLVYTQHNARLHLLSTLLVISGGLLLSLDTHEWAIIVLAMAIVWCAEALNTSVEFLCDLYSKEYHPLIEKAKDVAAAAVLVCSIGAALCGALIFIPKALALWHG